MKVKFDDIENAYEFVSSGHFGDHVAVVDKSTGKIFWHSESGDLDEIPEELWESDNSVEIPHKSDLELGKRLVSAFIESHSPGDYATVQKIFHRRGAYSRYKDLLQSKGLLQQWYDFEHDAQNKALRRWCEENDIELLD